MKKIIYSIMAVTAITMASCGAEAEETKKEAEETTAHEEPKQEEPVVVAIEGTYSTADSATVVWKGKHNKDEEFEHAGTILVSGSVNVAGNEITGGLFTLDITGLGDENEQLIGHLQSSDFFNVASFPSAVFEIGSIEDGKVVGSLDLLGLKHEIMFDADIAVTEESVSILGAAVVDLLPYNMPAFAGASELSEAELGDAVDASIVVEINLSLAK